jgi:hypothetical protein
VSSDFAPRIRLIGPNGAELRDTYGNAAAQAELNAPASGTYTVIVDTYDSGLDATGEYRLTLVKSPGPAAAPAGDDGGVLTNGAVHGGSIFLGDVDAWTFTATQGDYLVLSIGEGAASTVTADFAPRIRLIAPNGAELRDSYGDAAAQTEVTAPMTGTYTVIVSSYDSGLDGTGDYTVTLARAPGTFAVSTGDDGGALANNVERSGSIYVGDIDVWTFTATQGSSLTVTMREGLAATLTADFAPRLRLIGPTGAELRDTYNASVAQTTLTAPATGTYTLIVGTYDSGLDATGTYTVTVTGASAASRTVAATARR